MVAGGSIAAAGAGAPNAARAADAALWSGEYTAHKGKVKLAMYRRRATPPSPGAVLPVLFLVHGSSMGAMSTYDLTVPGRGDYSMMNVFAGYGFDVWTMDHEGYGKSDRTAENSDIASGVADLTAGMQVVRRETRLQQVSFFGESSGAIRAAAYAATDPRGVQRLSLSAFSYTGKGSPTLADRAKDVEFYRTHTTRPATAETYGSIFTRDKAGTADPAVADAMAANEAKYGKTIPTGTYLDMVTKLPLVQPEHLAMPVQLLRGEYDGISTEEDLLAFFSRLANHDKDFRVIPGASHSLVLGYNRAILWESVDGFIAAPPRTDHT
jgi:alpha-beta hydrolase superfamily lysophospholipase